jgi:hypothetical protein
MNKFISFKNWLNEQKEEPTYGCVMAEPKKIEGWEENHLAGIDKEDIYEDPNDDSYGLQRNPHLTLLFGVYEDKIDPTVVADMIEQKMKPFTVLISEIDFFERPEEGYDVVKYNVPVTKELQNYRNMFKNAFENTQTFSEYRPHITISYVKPGTGKKYKKKINDPFKVYFNKGVYSYHKEDGLKDDLIRKVVNLESDEEEKKKVGIINSKIK